LQADILELILHNVRTPEWNRFDLNALVAACRTAARRCIEIAERFGDDVFDSTMQIMLERNLLAMEQIIRMIVPETPAYFEDYLCDDGVGMGPYKICCKLWREGDVAIFDFEGTDPQAKSSINFYLSEDMFKMFFGSFTINLFDPHILFNDGFYELVDVRIPKGSLLKPQFPAALSGRTHALGRLFDILGGLLGQKTPEFLNAAGFSSSPHLFYAGNDSKGDWFQLFQIGFGGIPGRPMGDGHDGHSLWPGFTNVPNEFLERYFPLAVERYDTVADSGGAGLNRGGNGIIMPYRFLGPGVIALHDDRWFVPPWGRNGGKPGARARKILEKPDGSQVVLGNKVEDVKVEADDVLHFVTWGGGGWGDPLERDPALVAKEIGQGLVTVEGARAYGVVIGDDGQVDAAATGALREAMRGERGAIEVFDFGPDIETLRANCEAETGLSAPVQPRWADYQVAAE